MKAFGLNPVQRPSAAHHPPDPSCRPRRLVTRSPPLRQERRRALAGDPVVFPNCLSRMTYSPPRADLHQSSQSGWCPRESWSIKRRMFASAASRGLRPQPLPLPPLDLGSAWSRRALVLAGSPSPLAQYRLQQPLHYGVLSSTPLVLITRETQASTKLPRQAWAGLLLMSSRLLWPRRELQQLSAIG